MMVASNVCEKMKVELSILPGGLSENRGNANVRVICCFLERRSPKHGFGDALGARALCRGLADAQEFDRS